MSAATKALPVGWTRVLDEVQLRIDDALTSVNQRIETLPAVEPNLTAEDRLREAAQWSERLKRLSTFLESTEQIVQSVDEILQQEEARMKQAQADCGRFKQRLAEGAGRAIG